MADGTSFQIDVAARAAGVDDAARAVDDLATKLAAAGAASTAAADAVKAGEAAYKAAETSADQAAKALERVNVAVEANREKMRKAMEAGNEKAFWKAAKAADALAQRQTEAANRADVAKTSLAAQASALDALRAAATEAADNQTKLKEATDAAKAAAEQQAAAVRAAADAIKAADQAIIASTANRVAVLARAYNEEAKAIAAEDAKIAAETANRIAVLASAANEHARIEMKAAEKSDAASKLITSGSGKVNEMAEAFGRLGGPVGMLGQRALGSAEGLNKLFASLGTGKGVLAIAGIATAAIGAAIIALGAAVAKGLGEVSVWAVKLADKEKRLGKLSETLQKNITGIFGGLKIGKLLDGFESLVDLFDETSVTGKAIKTVFEDLFQPIIDGAAGLIPKVRSAFIQLEILVLKALIAIKPYGSTLLNVGVAIGVVAGLVVGVLVVAIGLLVAAVAASVAIFAAFTKGTAAAAIAIRDFVTGAVDFLSSFSLSDIGTNLIDGLVNGITGAGPKVLAALGGVVTGAIDSAKNLLGIASPSKVFAEIGQFTGEGMAIGVEDSTADVQSSLEAMVAPPAAAPAIGAGPSPAGGSVNLAGATFNFYGVEGAADAESRIGALLTRLLEGDVAQLGTAEPAT